ncbi:MAG: hypothetical protein HC828_15960 [Blastochloris sp.]|nr:hypothetical protein [Blastochloris sp.]
MSDTSTNVQRLDRAILGAIGVAIVGGIIAVISAASDTDRFIQFYLVAYSFVLQLALGSFALLMVHSLVRARWSTALQRIFAAGARTLPLLALLFIPIVLSMGRLYPWVNDAEQQSVYLNTTFFIIRAIIYFVVWIGIAFALSNLGYRNQSDPEVARQMQIVSIVGLILYFITASLASVDWLMSLSPDWFSSSYGVLEISRQALAAFSFAIIVLTILANRAPLNQFLNVRTRVDIGALLLVSLLMWVYLSYMQYNIIWSANIVSKVAWYEPRTEGTWGAFIIAVALLHGIALVALLLPGLKR